MKPLIALILRDWRLAWRIGGGAELTLVFFLNVVALIAFGLGSDKELLAAAAPTLLPIIVLLAVLLSLDRLFQADYEDGSLINMMLAPLPLEWTIIGKILAQWLVIGMPLIAGIAIASIWLYLPIFAWPVIMLSMLLCSLAFVAVGAISAALTVGVRRGGLLLFLMALPLMVPTLIFSVGAMSLATQKQDVTQSLLLLGADTVFVIAIAPFAAAAALRANCS